MSNREEFDEILVASAKETVCKEEKEKTVYRWNNQNSENSFRKVIANT